MPITFNDYAMPVCLPNGEKVKTGTTCFAAGWGLTGMISFAYFKCDQIDSFNNILDQDGVQPANILQHVALPIVDRDKCEDSYKNNRLKVNKTIMTCAGYDEGGRDACRGMVRAQCTCTSTPHLNSPMKNFH